MLIYFAILLIALLGFCGLVIDVGRVELRSLQLQAAADSAAVSAASEYQRTSDLAIAANAAQAELASNATLNGIPLATPTVRVGATSGNYLNDYSTLQVSVTQPVSTTLLSLIKGSHSSVNASATAVAMIPPCIYLFANPSSGNGSTGLALRSQGFWLTCPMYTANGFYVDGFSSIRNWQAKASGPPSMTYGGGWESPALIYNSPALADPLAYVVAPVFNNVCDHNTFVQLVPATLYSGTYCGGLKVDGTTVTLSPGTYIVTGDIAFTNGATINGTGVTLYMTKGGGSGFGTFLLNGNSFMYLSAPIDASAGGKPGILLMTDRAWVGGRHDIVFDQATMKGDGIIYSIGTGITNWQTPMSGYRYFGFVTANFTFTRSNLTFSSDYSQLPGGNPFRTVVSLVQ